MTIEQKRWDEISDDEWKAWGNTPTKIHGPVDVPLNGGGVRTEQGVVWEGLCAGWQETPAGGLEVRRRVELDAEHSMAFTFGMVGPGRWSWVETESFSYDLDAILARDAAEKQAMEAQAAAQQEMESRARLGLATPGGPSRAARRAGG